MAKPYTRMELNDPGRRPPLDSDRMNAVFDALDEARNDLSACIRERDFYFNEAQAGRTGELKAEARVAKLREALERITRNADRPGDMFSIAAAALEETEI